MPVLVWGILEIYDGIAAKGTWDHSIGNCSGLHSIVCFWVGERSLQNCLKPWFLQLSSCNFVILEGSEKVYPVVPNI